MNNQLMMTKVPESRSSFKTYTYPLCCTQEESFAQEDCLGIRLGIQQNKASSISNNAFLKLDVEGGDCDHPIEENGENMEDEDL